MKLRWIGDWKLDFDQGTLQKDEQTVRLSPLSLQVFDYLAQRQGELVTTETLLDTFWRGEISSDNAVQKAISELRRALGDSAREQRYIKTLPKRGYILVASVREIDLAEEHQSAHKEDGPFSAYRGNDDYFFVCYSHQDKDQVYKEIEQLNGFGFNLWFDEGIVPGAMWRAELADRISQCSQVLYYISNYSVASEHCDREVNFAIDCDKPVLPIFLEDVQLRPQLKMGLSGIQAIPKHELTEDQYLTKLIRYLEGVSLPAVRQTEEQQDRVIPPPSQQDSAPHKRQALAIALGAIVLAVTTAISLGWFGNQAPTSGQQPHSDVVSLYQDAIATRNNGERQSRLKALLRQYPDFVDGWAALAVSYGGPFGELSTEVQAQQRQAAQRAISLNPQSGLAQLAMSSVTHGEQKFAHIRKALELDPNHVDILSRAAYLFGSLGEMQKSIELYNKALELAPNDPMIHRRAARVYGSQGQNQQAEAHQVRATELDGARFYRPANYLAQNDMAGYVREHYHWRDVSEAPGGWYLNMSHAVGVIDPSNESRSRWLNAAAAAGVTAEDIVTFRLGGTFLGDELRWLSDDDVTVAIAEMGQEFSALANESFSYQMEDSALAFRQGDVERFEQIREQERTRIYESLDEYRTTDGFVIASILDIHFSEVPYFNLMMIAWSLGDEKLTNQLVDALLQHFSTPRLTNLGHGYRNRVLAWIAIIKGDFDSAIAFFDQAYRKGFSTRVILADIRRYDMRGELDELVLDERFQDLIARDRRKRAQEYVLLTASHPQIFDPSMPYTPPEKLPMGG